MATFTDAKKRRWDVVVSYDTIEEVRAQVDLDFLTVVEKDSKVIEKLMLDHRLLCQVLYLVLKDDADKAGVDARDFGKGLFGDALDAGFQALLGAIADFFPEPAERLVLKMQVGKLVEMRKSLAEKAKLELIPDLEKAMDAEFEQQLQASGGSSGAQRAR